MAGSGDIHVRSGGLIEARNLVVEYPARRAVVHAVSDVSFDLQRGETVGLVGESGCGKSSIGRALMQLETPVSGDVLLHGEPLGGTPAQLREQRRAMQMIFQDPVSSLNPSRRLRDIVREGIDIWGEHNAEAEDLLRGVLATVGLDLARDGDRRPHEFSGGQCQRICLARALVMHPEVLVLDEPVSALDVSVQAQILNLLRQLKADFELTMLFISHDLAVVRHISDRVIVMYLGKICEVASTDELFATPRHPYSRGLLASIPGQGDRYGDEMITGELPSPTNPPSGCRFHTRCPSATKVCTTTEPELRELDGGTVVACHHPLPRP